MRAALPLLGGLLVLLAFLAAGTLLANATRAPVPGSVFGMVLLAAGLRSGVLPVRWVRPAAELLIRKLGLLFVPPGVGLVVYGGLLRREWPAVAAASVVGTVAVLLVVGVLQQRLERDG